MTHPYDLIWDMAGRLESPSRKAALLRDEPGICTVTGQWYTRTADVKHLGDSYTDRSMFRAHTTRVGPAALWCGQGRGLDSLRLWSIIATPGRDLPPSAEKAVGTPAAIPVAVAGLCLTSKADTSPVIRTLTDPPKSDWMVTVATSGQKHVLPYGVVNHGDSGWTVRFEATNISSSPATFGQILDHAAHLRAAGHRPDDIESGRPTTAALKTADDLTLWRDHAAHLAPHTTSPALSLALWALTKEQINARITP